MLLVIESPNKIKKIKSYINAQILATVGHFKDLPTDAMGVDLDTYAPTFILDKGKADRIRQIKTAAKGQDVYIATDPDREGYAIGTHVFDEVRKIARSIHRLEIHEITQKGIDEAMKKSIPWENTNSGLYDAFLGRRVGDRVVGYILSPIASNALKGRFSVGRVQAPAVRLCVEREREIRTFNPEPFYVVSITLQKDEVAFAAKHRGGNLTDKAKAEAILLAVTAARTADILKVETKETRQNPKAPFTTVDMQAAASSQLKISPEIAMRLAQQLFEAGLISYHRTDSVRIADEFIADIRNHVGRSLGPSYLPKAPNSYKSKNSQAEAHEAIRPTHMHPTGDIHGVVSKEGLGADHEKLYTLIYRRTVASQMAAAVYDSTTVEIGCAGEPFRATGRVMKFDGFLKVYSEVREGDKDDEDDNQRLPPLVTGETVEKTGQKLDEKQTKPPGRYSEATLVKALEKHGIGRPSTYASIMGTIKARNYIVVKKGKIHATDVAERLFDFLAKDHPWIIDLELTRKMESYLDKVEGGDASWVTFVKGVHSKMKFARPPQRAAAGPGGVYPPSPAQLKFGTDLAKKHDREIPKDALESSRAMSAFIDGLLGKTAPGDAGTVKAPATKKTRGRSGK
ncbi:type I DNA topoisomerase [Oryzomonas sagensis]|uniref:DNA topoisomerase n=1 Tax=Oryzomonas sagensis TaxID=2603857 RepID=A0ABQ6TKS9_9BACT|nr:type I DNA topoisomerase [Oryzomonas sagensis]KAB0668354.1 type I DNA topoisomerase [Oryzomonas sagensis]